MGANHLVDNVAKYIVVHVFVLSQIILDVIKIFKFVYNEATFLKSHLQLLGNN